MSASQLLTKEEQEALGVRPTGTTPGAGNPAPTRRQSSPSIPARVVSGVLASRRGGRKTFTWGDNQENVQRTVIQNTPLAGRNTSGSTKVARAIANYVPQRPGELPFKMGDMFFVMDDAQKWWVVLNASGVKGKIPSNHVKVTGALDMRMRSATTSSPTSRQLVMAAKLLEQQQSRAGGGGGAVSDGGGDGAAGSARGGGGGGSSSGGGGSGSGSGAGPAAPHMAYVLADYNAVREGELSIKKGEAITVVDDRKKWWVVRNQGGEVGKAPSNFFVMADNPYAVQGQVEVQIAAELAQLRSAANEQNRRVADSSMAQAYADAQIRAREEIKRIAAIAFARANKSRIPTPSAAAHAAASSPSPLSTVAASVDSDSGSSGRESLIAPISAAVSTPSAEAAPLRPTAQSASDIAAEDLAERAAETAAAAAEATAAAAAEAAAEEEEEEAVAAAAPSSASGKSKPKRKAPKAQWRIDMEEKAKSEKAARRKQDKLRKELKNTIKDQQAMRRAKAEANKLMIKENTRNMVSQAFNPPPPPENPDDFDFVGMDANILEEEDAMRWNAMGITNPAFLETGRLRRADSGQVARAVRDYIAESPAEISVLQDELVIVLDDREAYWIVRGMDGDGKVPESVFELDGESPERPISSSSSPVVDLPEVTWGSRTQTPTTAGGTTPIPTSSDDESDVVISGEIGRFWELAEAARARGEGASMHVDVDVDVGDGVPTLPLIV